MIFIIGGNGLTGSAIVRYCCQNGIEHEVIQRHNSSSFLGKPCDILIYANGNAMKWRANNDPLFDFHASVGSLATYLHGIKFKRFVFLSTVDVYSKKESSRYTAEDSIIDEADLDTYGYHKLIAEKYVKKFVKDKFLILRLPGIVGPGLTKNPVFDYIHQHKKVMVSKKSKLCFIHTDQIADILFQLLQHQKYDIYNVASSNSIQIQDIESIVGFKSAYTEEAALSIQNYQINTDKLKNIIDIPTSEDAIALYYKHVSTELNE